MSHTRYALAFFCSFILISAQAIGQQAYPPPISATTLVQQSLAVQLGNTQVSDVTLTGTARRIAGSDDESGTVTLKVLSSSATRLDFKFPSGPRTELKSFDSGVPIGTWSGPDGIPHPISNHNLVNDWGWFPAFTLAISANTQNYTVSFVGAEPRNDASVLHVVAFQQFPALSGGGATFMQRLSQIDIFLDASTRLPASIAYNTHPDNNALLDIPVELRFSDYRSVGNGLQTSSSSPGSPGSPIVPFHVQKFINNTLALDLQFQSAAMNTGITAAQIGAQ